MSFTPIFGLSVVIHLTIIVFVLVKGVFLGEKISKDKIMFRQERVPRKNRLLNRIISYFIVTFVGMYMILLGFVAVTTAIDLGEAGGQFLFYKSVFVTLLGFASFIVATPEITIGALVSTIVVAYSNQLYFGLIRIVKLYVHAVDKLYQIIESVVFRTLSLVRHSVSKTRIWIGMLFGIVLILAIFAIPVIADAQIVEPGFESEVVATGFTLPTAAAFTPDGRILVAEKGGAIKIVKDGSVLPSPLVVLTDVNTFGDRGLLGLAVDPDFANNGYIYVSYAYENTPGINVAGPKTGRIVRLTVAGDTASESTKVVIVGTVGGNITTPSCEDYAVTDDCIASDSNSHSVGGLRFGPDGMLYATLGDGADFAAVDSRALRAQNVDALAGKVLRINTDGTGPSDNPFYDGDSTSNRSKVYALGVRNMFRFNFNEETGKLYGGDVGWGSWEEVNDIIPGANYGWPCREGAEPNAPYACSPSSPHTDPLYTYPHDAAGAGSITAGSFMSNGAYPSEYETSFFMADYAQMWMKRLVLDTSGNVVSVEDFINGNIWPVEIITGPDGHIYYIDIVTTDLVRLTHTEGNRRPVVLIDADPLSGLSPLSVDFSTAGTFDPDADALSYEWMFGDGGTSLEPNPTHEYTSDGSYDATVTVTDAPGASVSKSIKITVGDQAPEAIIVSPSSGALYEPLEEVTVIGDGIDPEDGTLPASAFEWTVLLHHNTHTHTVQQFSNSKEIIFVADDHLDSDVYMEIILEVTDSAGLTDTQSINMYLNNGVGSGNLINNPSMEIVSSIPDIPLDWFENWYGSMTVAFDYPVAGFDGDRAAEVIVSNYSNGAAKWIFAPVNVTEGELYTFSNQYTADVSTEVLAQFGMADGSNQYEFFAVVPPTANPVKNTFEFIVPTDAKTVTVFHELTQDGTLVVDDFSVRLSSELDETPPSGSITSPENGSVISGLTPFEIDANDDVAVATVHLAVDGLEVGVGDSEPPYSIVWDSTTVPDGVYDVTAHIHDTGGNEFETAIVSVTVDNSGSSSSNLILNGNFELDAGDGTPIGWSEGGWGTNTRVHTYPVPGSDGGVGAEVTITNYGPSDTGDARWTHDAVSIQSGVQYRYDSMYKATTISDVLGRYEFEDGSEHFFGLIKEIQGTDTWTPISGTFVPPVGATSISLGHAIGTEATVTIDEVGLFEIGTGTPSEINPPTIDIISPAEGETVSGTVTLIATSSDDTGVSGVYFALNGTPYGPELTSEPYSLDWDTTEFPNGTYLLKATTHDVYGNNDNIVITVTVDNTIIPPTEGNLVPNPDFELGSPGAPTNWRQGGWGSNDRTFTYPVPGESGDGSKVEITSFGSGDAKWYFDDVAISPDTEYTIGNSYNANVGSSALIRYTSTGGDVQYEFVDSFPATGGSWQTWSELISTPPDAASLTLFHVIAGVGELTVDNYLLTTDSGTTTPPDTTPPSVDVISPSDGATVSGTVSVNVSASDASGVSGVQLFLDGSSISPIDSSAPYTFNWNSASVSDGPHMLLARATDIHGNVADSDEISITVDNSEPPPPPPPGNNLVLNGEFESDNGDGTPVGWRKGGWGSNTRSLSYPVPGLTGNGAKVEITSYSSGDAKWYFDDVAVTSGEQYSLSYAYNATIPSNITIRYTRTDGSYLYAGAGTNPATDGAWETNSISVVPPPEVESLTIYPLINQVGELTIDDFVLSTSEPVNTFGEGMVTFSFDDGWVEHASIGAPMLDGAGIDGTFYLISDVLSDGETPTNLVPNPNLESGGTLPTNWNQGGWGTNNRVFTYPSPGESGNGAKVEITSYSTGDAKWYFDDVVVAPNTEYFLAHEFMSTVESAVILRYTLSDGGTSYQFLDAVPDSGGVWQSYTRSFTTPSDAASLTVFHIIAGVGELTIDSFSLNDGAGGGSSLYVSTDEALAMQSVGHEIGAHTRTHVSLTGLDTAEKIDEIEGSRDVLLASGFSPVETFSYPFGDYDDEVQTLTADAGFTSARTVDRGFNETVTDKYALKIQQVGRTTPVSTITAWIDQAAANKTWLILMFHQISDDASETFGITEAELQSVVDYTQSSGVSTVTVSEGVSLMD